MKLFITILFSLLLSINLNASDKTTINDISFGYGDSVEDINIYRISLKKDLNKYIFENDYKFLPKYYETSLGYWKAKDGNSLVSFSFSPVFRHTFFKDYYIKPYVEAGVGGTYISKTKLQDENFGIHFQFETFGGVGFKLNDFDFAYRYMHYSNLVHENNSGVTLNFFSVSYAF